MSWNVSANGKASAVAEVIAAQFAKIKCSEPEESIKNAVAGAVAAALQAYPTTVPVKVNASGSQSTDSRVSGAVVNELRVSIEPMWGFCQ